MIRRGIDLARDALTSAPSSAAVGAPARPQAAPATVPPAPVKQERNWELSGQAELIDHIVSHHHEGLRRELPTLIDAARQLEREQAQHQAAPLGLADTLEELSAELEAHMLSEEDSLFPMLRTGARGGPVDMQLRMMERDHDDHSASLRRIREQTANLTAPAGVSAEWTALYAQLAALEADLREHIYLEDAVLFARASGSARG